MGGCKCAHLVPPRSLVVAWPRATPKGYCKRPRLLAYLISPWGSPMPPEVISCWSIDPWANTSECRFPDMHRSSPLTFRHPLWSVPLWVWHIGFIGRPRPPFSWWPGWPTRRSSPSWDKQWVEPVLLKFLCPMHILGRCFILQFWNMAWVLIREEVQSAAQESHHVSLLRV